MSNANGVGSIQTRVTKKGEKVYDVHYRYYSVKAGKTVNTTKRGFSRKGDAQRYLDKISNQINTDTYVTKNNKTVTEVANEWFSAEIEDRVKPNTVNWYRVNKDNHIITYLGNTKIQDVTVEYVQELYDIKLESGLKETTVSYIHRTLRRIFKYAVKKKYVTENVLESPDLRAPGAKRTEIKVIDMTEINDIVFDSQLNKELKLAIALAGMMGLRRGEVLGLRWSQITWDKKTLELREQRTNYTALEETESLKTDGSARILPIPDVVVQLLQEQRNRLEAYKKLYGQSYDFENGFVCCRFDADIFGKSFRPPNFSKLFSEELKRLGYQHIRFHDLRHSYASHLLQINMPVTVVAKLLGHVSPDITLKIYAHVSKAADIQAFKEINKNLSGYRADMFQKVHEI